MPERKGIEKRERHFREAARGILFADAGRICFWSAVMALICTLISYPGIWYSDSYVRVSMANAVLNTVVNTLKGHPAALDTWNAFTVIPSFFIAASIGLTGQVGLYTFVQAFSFFAMMFLLVREMSQGVRILPSVLLACCPLIYGMSVYYEAGIGCVTGIAGLLLLLWKAKEEKSGGERAVEFMLMMVFSFIAIGYRTNALTILPVLGYYLLRMKAEKKRKAMLLFAVICGTLLTKGLPLIFQIHSQSAASVGIVWEMLTAIQRIPAEEQEPYLDYLDEIGGEGSTREALELSIEETSGSFTSEEVLGPETLSAPGVTRKAIQKYFQLMTERPGEWFSVKRDVILRAMGIGMTLDISEYSYDRWGSMSEFGMSDSAQRKMFYHSCVGACTALGAVVLHPWVVFLISAIFIAVEQIRKHPRRKLYAMILWLAAFYYLAYLLDTPAYDFRYFYPSLYLMMVMDLIICINHVRFAISGLKKSLKKKDQKKNGK